jgi:hypothetical protein
VDGNVTLCLTDLLAVPMSSVCTILVRKGVLGSVPTEAPPLTHLQSAP